LRFGAASYAFVFADADLALPLHTANPRLAAVHESHLAQHIEELAATAPVSTRARELIAQALPDGEPTRRTIASAMCLSERTLQRRLLGEASSYQALLDATRRELAERYLASRDVSLAEAACLLGFSGQTSFTRACRRWFAASPRRVRMRSASP
jgi:AraC-like DNA-binding protein